ncbi:MAG: CocE/NonD family hydrolase [Parvibaculaceae bacterium]
MDDGVGLSALLRRPSTGRLVGAVVEIIPYRQHDNTIYWDHQFGAYLAGCGIAYLRVDVRGTGDSEGLLADEYLPREQEDALAVIEWAARQPWSNGKVGMTGISWGGFASLQVAARRPPALKAILPMCASDDRYADDIHFMGGALLTEDAMWSNYMLNVRGLPPDPAVSGPHWRELWRARQEANVAPAETWLSHQRRDAYWKHGSVSEDYSAITCAVFAVCGWDDSYSNVVHRLLAGLTCPRLGLMGPWTHTYGHVGEPGPAVGFLQEAVRWWRHWLMDEDTGIMDEPMYRVFVMGSERPKPFYLPDHEGFWIAEREWPSPRIERRILHLDASSSPGLSAALSPLARRGAGGEALPLTVRSPATAGMECGRWGGYGGDAPDMPLDQRHEDVLSLCFDSEPLEQGLVLLGAPEIEIEVTVDHPRATLVARLCDVWPDGTSALMTYGVLNLAHRDSHEHPEACPVGEPFRVRLKLNGLGRHVTKGHRIRLALSNQHWPVLWPQPSIVTLSLVPGRGTLTLPVREANEGDAVVFEPAEAPPETPQTVLRKGFNRRTLEEDVGSGLRTLTLESDYGRTRYDDREVEVAKRSLDRFTIHPDDPLSARLETDYVWTIRTPSSDVETHTRTELTADGENFFLSWRIETREAGRLTWSRARTTKIRRDFA